MTVHSSGAALRVSPAETRLAVYCWVGIRGRLQLVGIGAGERVSIVWPMKINVLDLFIIIHCPNFLKSSESDR